VNISALNHCILDDIETVIEMVYELAPLKLKMAIPNFPGVKPIL
jgi:hypothetical protein